MADYNITLDFSNETLGMEQINKLVADRIHAAIGMAAQSVYASWADRVMKAPGIWKTERDAYIHSLQWNYTGAMSARVWSDYKIADEIETGRPARDLKRMLQTSSKTRQGKNGKYLIIPFRHNTPGGDGHSSYAKQMPAAVYAVARQLAPSRITGAGTRLSATGATVAKSSYQWGGRAPAGMAPKLKPHHATDPYSGMVKMKEKNSTKAASYLTFRVMTERSNGWIIPAQPGKFIARDIAQEMTPDIDKIMSDALGE